MIKKCQRLLKAGKNIAYTEYANKVNKAIISRKKSYFRREYTIGNPNWWGVINDLTKAFDTQIDDPELAKNINNGFYSVWNGEEQPDISSFHNRPFSLPKTPIFTPSNICEALNQLKRSPGPEKISARLLKSSRYEICEILEKLFNIFLEKGFILTQWFQSNITPIPCRLEQLQTNITHIKPVQNIRKNTCTEYTLADIPSSIIVLPMVYEYT
jgi:hypothetical protein